MGVTFKDNGQKIKSMMQGNIKAGLTAMGQTATEMIVNEMNYGFYRRIYLSGDLQRDVNFKPIPDQQIVKVGSSLEYAVPVHEGTGKMPARPYIKNGIMNNKDAIFETGQEYLKKGFE